VAACGGRPRTDNDTTATAESALPSRQVQPSMYQLRSSWPLADVDVLGCGRGFGELDENVSRQHLCGAGKRRG
jgi:hypothetical protein